MYEEGTPLESLLSQGEIEELDEETSLAMYEHLLDATAAAGFEQYEISNFAQPGMQSLHNSAYWHGIPYLGIGAGAHSYDGQTRQFCPDSLADYLESIRQGIVPLQQEVLTTTERYDEFVFTALRTRSGLDMAELSRRFGQTLHDYCLKNAQKHIEQGRLHDAAGRLRLTRKGLFVSNDVMSDLMWID
jgi:oxygen-independent coproporphyrinogen-3 oxidase